MHTLQDITRGVRLTSTWVDRNPHMDDSRDMDHWRCTLSAEGRRMVVYYSKGFGHNGEEPTVAELLDCLASDAAGVENATGLVDWCAEYGYDANSRSAERTYRTIQRQSDRLRFVLGEERYEALLWDTERL